MSPNSKFRHRPAVLSDTRLMAQMGEWGPCSLPCGGGIQNRTVQCTDQFNKSAPSTYCVSANQPPDQLQCNLQPCDFCSSTDCSNQVGMSVSHLALVLLESKVQMIDKLISKAAASGVAIQFHSRVWWTQREWT